MDEPIRNPLDEAIRHLQKELAENEDTFTKVCNRALELDEYVHHSKVATNANCSENAAKKHLNRLATLGVVEKRANHHSLRFRRNTQYLEWWWANHLAATLSKEQLMERINLLEERDKEFRERHQRESPIGMSMIVNEDATTSERISAGREWRHVRRQLQIHEIACYFLQNNGHLISSV